MPAHFLTFFLILFFSSKSNLNSFRFQRRVKNDTISMGFFFIGFDINTQHSTLSVNNPINFLFPFFYFQVCSSSEPYSWRKIQLQYPILIVEQTNKQISLLGTKARCSSVLSVELGFRFWGFWVRNQRKRIMNSVVLNPNLIFIWNSNQNKILSICYAHTRQSPQQRKRVRAKIEFGKL